MFLDNVKYIWHETEHSNSNGIPKDEIKFRVFKSPIGNYFLSEKSAPASNNNCTDQITIAGLWRIEEEHYKRATEFSELQVLHISKSC